MIDVDQLLTPLSEEAPCGGDLSYDPALSELDTLMQGKPETQFSAAEEPNWRDVQKACLALFERTKDLRVSIGLAVPLLKIDGLPGFAQGLWLLHGLLDKYWEPVYPRLDPDDNNDPLQRMNLVASLAAPEGTFGDNLRFISRIRETPVCRSARGGAFNLAQIAAALSSAPPEGTPPIATIAAVFKDSDPEFIKAQRDAVDQATLAVTSIDDYITATVGSGQSPNLQPLKDVLKEAKQRLNAYAPAPVAAGEDATDADADPGAADASSSSPAPARRSGGGAPGTISSREDVTTALDAICAWYGANEPSSPVAALLAQAKKLVGLNFMEILAILSPEATPQVKLTAEPASDATPALDTETPAEEIPLE